MEFEGEDGSKFSLQNSDKTLFGRGCGFDTKDHTVSRHHVSVQLNNESDSEPPKVSFQVIGRNPIWVLKNNDETLKIFKKFEMGHLELGDRFCLSAKTPFWFNLKKSEDSESEIEFDQLDISQIDPVKEFGFLVMRHEFDQYPKGMIRNVENWEWFLEEPSKESEDEDDFEDKRKMKGKRKVFRDNKDDEWTGDSDDDKELVAKVGKGKKPRYSARSKDNRGPKRDIKDTSVDENDEEDDDDDDDETLGGFIVTDEEDEDEEQNNDNEDEEEEEEEEFEEEDDDDAVAG